MKTSKSSEVRIKKGDPFTTEKEALLYKNHSTMDLEAFRAHCQELIAQSRGSDSIKFRFDSALIKSPTKDKLVKTTVDYFYAGKGLKV